MERLPYRSLMAAQHFELGDFTFRNRFGRAASQEVGCGEEREARSNEPIIDHTKQNWYFSNASSALTPDAESKNVHSRCFFGMSWSQLYFCNRYYIIRRMLVKYYMVIFSLHRFYGVSFSFKVLNSTYFDFLSNIIYNYVEIQQNIQFINKNITIIQYQFLTIFTEITILQNVSYLFPEVSMLNCS
ncbi:Hypothetical_protein [Hexamita inflata]|uniref:Hypothetical_protein n=1 Tax=Hexamita inflata TaxID=28002 RepID=A0AA86QTX3_9EUKA|nr:Hypothetical protein HINF_LOCUS46884 [Hexamita inflata]